MEKSVLPVINRTYDRHWKLWKSFLKTVTQVSDPLLSDVTEEDKAALVELFLCQRHKAGLRAKAATSATVGLRMQFTRNLQSTAFLDAVVIATARQSCQLNPSELRNMRDNQPTDTVKLPACHGTIGSWSTRCYLSEDFLTCYDRAGCSGVKNSFEVRRVGLKSGSPAPLSGHQNLVVGPI